MVRVWNIRDEGPELLYELKGHRKTITCADFSPDDRIALPQPGSIQHILLSMAAEKQLGKHDVFDNQLVTMKHPDGMTALESFGRLKPDLIFLDVLLPRLDGIEVLKRLRSTEDGRNVPVVMMSAVLQIRDLKAETARLNVTSILQKPFRKGALARALRSVMQSGQRPA